MTTLSEQAAPMLHDTQLEQLNFTTFVFFTFIYRHHGHYFRHYMWIDVDNF